MIVNSQIHSDKNVLLKFANLIADSLIVKLSIIAPYTVTFEIE